MERQTAGSELRPYAFVLAGVMLGGLSPVLTKLLLLQNVAGETIVAARYLLAVLLLLPIGLPYRPVADAPPPDRRAWLTLILVGVFGSGLGALLFTAAVDLSSAGVVTAISKTAPIFVTLFVYFTLRERVTYLRLLLVLVMVAADVLIAAGELTFSGQLVSARLLGDALALLAGMSRAAAEILGKSALRRFRPNTVALWRFGVGLTVAAAVSAGTGGWASLGGLGLRGWLILIALGGVSTSLSMSLYYRGLSEIPAHIAVTLKLLGAVVTVIVSWIVLGEALTPYHIAGIGVLISGAYLLVMRSAHPQVKPVTRHAIYRPWAGIRPRFIALVVMLVVGSVSVVWYLAIRHSSLLLQEQLKLTIGEMGAILADFGDQEQRPSWQAYQRYLDRVIGHQVEGEMYLLEVVYVAVLDERGNLGAFAMSDRLSLVDEQGRKVAPGDRVAEQRFLRAMDAGGARRHRLITATVHRMRAGRLVGTVKMGCTRELQEGMIGEVVGRSAVAALTVLLLAVAVAVVAGGSLIEPIERLAAEVCRSHGGRVSGRTELDEVDEIRHGVGRMVEQLRAERGALAALRSALAAQVFEGTRRADDLAGRRIALALDARRMLAEGGTPEIEATIETLAREVVAHGGRLRVGTEGVLGATWGDEGAERDDVLRASLAAMAVAERLRPLAGLYPLRIGLASGAGTGPALERAAALWEMAAEPGDEVHVLVSADLLPDVTGHLCTANLGDGAEAGYITGPAEAGVQTMAGEPEDMT